MELTKIEPALTPNEWAEALPHIGKNAQRLRDEAGWDDADIVADYRRTIALRNANLAEGDPRKITREMAQSIRRAAEWIDGAYDSPSETERRKPWTEELRRYANALESYLPPVSE